MNDTVRIKEVMISRNKFQSSHSGYKETAIDSTVLLKYSNSNLSDMLNGNTEIFIKSYGMGGTATPSFRGTDAGQTIIDWNGININSPMLGQSDLSLLPVGLVDNVQICFGGASMSLNDGGIGGTINLETKPVWNNQTLISINSEAGSFGRYSGLIKVITGNSKFQTITKGYFQNAENNFRYLNTVSGPDPVWQTRTNSQVSQNGFMQEFYVRNSENIASARIWYQSADRNLPSSLLTEPVSGEKQFDESLRTMLNYDAFKGNSKLSLTGAWTLSRLNYENRLASIDSRNLSESMTLKACLENPVGDYAKLKITLDEQLCFVKSNNYAHNITRNTTTITSIIDRNGDRLGTTILIREILDKRNFLIPDFSAGVQFRIIDAQEYFLKANVSRNSKIPTMNDMFWVPGGNPSLKNEYALIYEFSFDMSHKITDLLNLKYDLSVFRYNINNMIQWHPGEYSYWTADNIANVTSTGGESSVSLEYVKSDLNASLKADYSYTRAMNGGSNQTYDELSGKQLMYIPENQAKALFKIGYRNIYSLWTANFTGKRYITAENSSYLQGYFINSLSAGIKLVIKATSLDISLNADNLFNVNYQSIAYYPLPGRAYSVKISVQIIK
jgi:outer membrane cobalamin receptor